MTGGSPAGRRRQALAALAGALVGAAFGALLGGPLAIPESAFLAAAMAAIAAEDARAFRVPDAWSLVAALGGLAAAGLGARAGLDDPLAAFGGAALRGLVCGGVFLLIREAHFRLRGADGLGLGDVKLAGVAGTWLGWQAIAPAIMLAAFAALAFVAAESLRGGGWARERRIPFGAFLAPAIWVAWLAAALAFGD